MSTGAQGFPMVPFFLPAPCGERFCVFHPAVGAVRGAVLYLHPFAEEMNKARRVAALQSRSFAARGFAVLQMDLFGCGDSGGHFGDASWEIWRQDVALGAQWLRQHACEAVTFWGLRLGALLALDAAREWEFSPGGFVLWQPVLSGEALLTQFLRLRLAGEMLSEGTSKTGVQELRTDLASGQVVEIAGYDLTRRLAAAIDGLKLADLEPAGQVVHWFELVAEAGRGLPLAARRVADSWTQSGVQLEIQCVPGQPFWSTVEIVECPALIAGTTKVVAG